SNGGNGQGYLNRLVVRRQSQFRLLPVQKVLWFGTEYRLVYAYTEKRRYPIDLGLEQLEQRLDPTLFVRVHRSAIVNVSRIQEIIPTSGGRCKILLDDPQQRILPLSASRARMLKDLVKAKVSHH
ncbi:MAG: LytTR family DNA-binding domain-containing protein, partial [candidate division KSB1 bacterium]|nr:LytTR family DNA-binding domain-containing protein [candidate division KSB1 bacterium]